LATFLNTLSIFLLLRIEDNPSYKNITLAGVAIGLSALCRTNILLFVPFLLIWFLKLKIKNSKFKILRKYLFLCLIILLTISPATIRNYLVSGKFVFISTNGPISLWIGNNPYANGEFYYPPSFYGNKVAKMVEERGDSVYIEEVLKFFREKPADFLSLQIKKIVLFWDKNEIENNVTYSLQKGYSALLKLPIFLSFNLIGAFGLFGIFLSFRNKRVFLLHLFIFVFMISTVSFFITARYRSVFIPVLIAFAGFSIWWVYKKIKDRMYKPLFFSIVLLVLSFLMVYFNTIYKKVSLSFHSDGFHIKSDDRIIVKDTISSTGNEKSYLNTPQDIIKKELIIKENLSDYKEVMVSFNFSAVGDSGLLMVAVNNKEIAPTKLMDTGGLMAFSEIPFPSEAFIKGANQITISQLKEGNVSIVIDTFQTFGRSFFMEKKRWKRVNKGEYMVWLTLYPDSKRDWAQEYCNRGKSFFNEGLYKEAEDQLKKALEVNPRRYEAHQWLGLCYEAEKELEKAIMVYKNGLSILTDKNSSLELHNNLARLYYEKGMIDDAIEETKKIIAINPKDIQAHNNLIGLQKYSIQGTW
jgi:hypothetical protein